LTLLISSHLDGHLVVLVACLRAGVLLVGVLGAAAMVEHRDLFKTDIIGVVDNNRKVNKELTIGAAFLLI
jgi:hypothetical protein